MNIKELEKIYDGLYAEAEAVLKEFNPCEHKLINEKHSCLGQSDPHAGNDTPQCCCGGCEFWTKRGCSAEKPLTCKTWLCTITRLKYPKVAAELDKIRNKTVKYGFYVYRGDKSASLKNAEIA